MADKATKVIEEADRLKDEGKVEESTELINALNKSINTAHKMVKQKDAPADAPPSNPKPPEPVVSLPVVTDATNDLTQEDAIRAAKAVVRFLRSRDASDFTPDQSGEWYRVGNEIAERLGNCRFSSRTTDFGQGRRTFAARGPQGLRPLPSFVLL